MSTEGREKVRQKGSDEGRLVNQENEKDGQ